MSGFDLFALQFAQASAGCVLAGLAALGLLNVAARHWPALRASRAPWLLAQGLCVAALALALLPQRERLSVVPAVEIESAAASIQAAAPVPLTAAMPAALLAPLSPASPAPIDAAPAPLDWLSLAARAWCAVYLGGLAFAAHRLLRGERAMRRLLASAERDGDSADGVNRVNPADRVDDLPVYRVDLPLSPMLLGFIRPVLLLPRQFDQLDPAQRMMIIAHERTHLARRDPLWRLAAALARTLTWFNPAMRQLQARLMWAQEAGCDRAVLAAATAAARRVYAGALVEQFRRQQAGSWQACGALAFTDAADAADAGSLSDRMRLIRDGGDAGAGRTAHAMVTVAGVAIVAAVLALQPAYAWRKADQPAPSAVAAAGPLVAWQAPLARARVSSVFGVTSPLRPTGHHGIDLAARRGTPVLAAADGVVETSGDLDAGGAKYGKTVSIRHADGRRSFYAHLDARQVAAGDAVRAGQVIGRSGATGKVSGPHLHFEVRENGTPVDPAGVLDVLASATPAALRQR